MKRLLTALFALCLCASVAKAAGIQIAWDASPSVGVTNYVVYSALGTNALGNPISVGTNQSIKLTAFAPGIWKFAITAVRDGLESDFSPTLIIDTPQPPANLRTVNLQATAVLTNGAWQNIGFFRLQIAP